MEKNGGGLKVYPRKAAVYTATTSSQVGVIWLVDMQVSCRASKVDFADNIYYYLDGTSSYTADIFVRYDISDDFYVRIDYDGPLSEELSTDELIQNLCNLVKTIN